MAYSDFDQRTVRERFGLTLCEDVDLDQATLARFLRRDGAVAFIDLPGYDFDQLGKILGILLAIIA
jgi:hypothetical protein